MKKSLIILGSLLVVLTFAVSGFSKDQTTRKPASVSMFEGNWDQISKDYVIRIKISGIEDSKEIVSVIEKQKSGDGTTVTYLRAGVFDPELGIIYVFREESLKKFELKDSETLVFTRYFSAGKESVLLYKKVK